LDFDTRVRGSAHTEALRFCQERGPELKCCTAAIKSSNEW